MITAISSVKQNILLSNNTNLKKVNSVTFTGNPIGVLKTEGKVSRLVEGTIRPIISFVKKMIGKAELPFSKKPLTANADLTHFLPDGTPITIPMPEVHTAATKILDGANILNPDATDLAANVADALSTKAALVDVLSGTNHAFDAVTDGLDAATAKASVVDAVTTGLDVVTTKAGIVDTARNVIHGIAEVIGKIL